MEEQVVAPSSPVVPPVFAHAIPPEAAVASADERRFVTDPAAFFPTMTFGVPPSAATEISTTVAAYGM